MKLDSTLGVTRLGHYRLVRRLAVGGMAELFVAVAEGAGDFEKPVAIKRILPRLAREPQFVEMFFAEAQLAASLDHPHIAKVLDFGEEGELPYIVMEFVPGVDLADLLKMVRGPLPTEEAVTIAVQLAEALHYVHEHRDLHTGKPLGLVHRDVSPSNVLIGYSGGAKLTDFGIVKATSATQYTATGALKGKLSYLSPEQARCERIDRRTDIYAVGLVLFELFTGRRMHRALSEVALLARVCDGEFTPPSQVCEELDPGLEAIISRALQPSAGDRYPTARALGRALETLASERGWSLSMGRLSDYVETVVPNPGPIRLEPSLGSASPTAVAEPSRSLTRFVKTRGRPIAIVSALLGLGIGVGVGPSLARTYGAPDPPPDPAPAQPHDDPPPPAVAENPPPTEPSAQHVEPPIEPSPGPESDEAVAPPAAEPTSSTPTRPRPKRRRRSTRRGKSRKKKSSLDSSLLPPSER